MKKINQILFVIIFVNVFFSTLAISQTLPGPTSKPAPNTAADYLLVIKNEDGRETKISLAEIRKLKRQTIKTSDHGQKTTFEGVALAEVLKLAGIEFGESLRGKRLANFLLAEAADNYQAVFALPELDSAFTDKLILLADKRDGQPLSEKEGQLRIVVPDEKKQARWVRQIIGFKILRAGAEASK